MKKIIFVALLLFFTHQRKVNVTCGDCTISCATGSKCYTLSGNDGLEINEEVCADVDTCTWTTLEYNAVNCDVDLFGQECSSKACVAPVGLSVCYQSSGTCDSSINTVVECGACGSTAGCTNCMKTTASGSTSEACMDQYLTTCDWKIQSSFGTCSQDSFGASCSCCIQAAYSGNVGTCTANDPLWSKSTKIGDYAFESILKASLMLLLLVIFF